MIGRVLAHHQYIGAIAKGELLGLKCNDCGKVIGTPKQLCSKCQGGNLSIVTLSGRGSVAGFTVVNVPAPKFEQYAPFAVAHINLEENAKITARLIDIDPEKVEIGLKVEMDYVDRGGADIELVFRPV